MCLDSIDSTGIKPVKEGWKVFRDICSDGILIPLYYGTLIEPEKWVSTRSFLDKLLNKNNPMIYVFSALSYEAGYHVFHNKEDAIVYQTYHPLSVLRKVLVKDPICVGYESGHLVTVARKIKVLSKEESKWD